MIMQLENIDIALLSVYIENIHLSNRLYYCLKRSGISTIKDVILRTEYEISAIRHLGEKSYEELISIIHKMGLKFRPEYVSKLEWENFLEGKEISNKDEIFDVFLQTPINALEFNARAVKYFNSKRILTIGDLVVLNRQSLIYSRNLGSKSIEMISLKLKDLGLDFCPTEIKPSEWIEILRKKFDKHAVEIIKNRMPNNALKNVEIRNRKKYIYEKQREIETEQRNLGFYDRLILRAIENFKHLKEDNGLALEPIKIKKLTPQKIEDIDILREVKKDVYLIKDLEKQFIERNKKILTSLICSNGISLNEKYKLLDLVDRTQSLLY